MRMQRLRYLAVATLVAFGALVATAGPALAGGDRAVYTLTNSSAGNAVAVYDRASNGSLTPAGTVAIGGLGTGAGLGSQGALTLEHHRLLAVNAGSNSISLLRVKGGGLVLRDVEPSGGVHPISITAHDHLVYVLNNGDAVTPANIAGFWIRHGGLVPLPGSSRPLSEAAPGPAQIQFSNDGRQLAVTEKNTNRIVTYRVGDFGYAGGPNVQPSAGVTPFGFDFDNRDRLIVSEAYGGAPDASVVSSYSLAFDGTVSPITPNVATTETAACWVAVTDNGRYAYATNTGSASVSGYTIGPSGSLSLLNANGKTATTGTTPIDVALSDGSSFLYVLASGVHEIDGYRVNPDGSLTSIGAAGGLVPSTVGLAAS
jgi:6-phosphogluconolactonase